MKKLGVVLLTLMLMFAVASCGSSEPEKTQFGVNEVATFNGVEYTVANVETSQGDEFDEPANGKEYVIVTVKIDNKSDETISYNGLDWQMKNDEGQMDEYEYLSIIEDDELSSGDLAAGGSKTGKIAFEEPKDSKTLSLLFFENSLFDDEPTLEFIVRGELDEQE